MELLEKTLCLAEPQSASEADDFYEKPGTMFFIGNLKEAEQWPVDRSA